MQACCEWCPCFDTWLAGKSTRFLSEGMSHWIPITCRISQIYDNICIYIHIFHKIPIISAFLVGSPVMIQCHVVRGFSHSNTFAERPSQAIPGHQTQYQILKPGTGKDAAWDGRARSPCWKGAWMRMVQPFTPKKPGIYGCSFHEMHEMIGSWFYIIISIAATRIDMVNVQCPKIGLLSCYSLV